MATYKKPNANDVRFIMGDIGERAVARQFMATRSEDWYDSTKDGEIGELKYEVKTMRLNFKTMSFWVGQNKTRTQWAKIDSCDALIFVRIPEKETERAGMYLCINHRNSWFKAYRNDGVAVKAFPLKRCIKIADLSKEESLTLFNHSCTISEHRRFEEQV